MRLDKKRLFPEDKGRLVTAFLESFFAKYVGYDFTADLEEKLDQVSNSEIDWKALLRDFWNDFSSAVAGTKDLGTRQVLDSLNELLGPHIFPARGDGVDPRLCPLCGEGQLSLKLGKYGAFIGCSRYPECKFSRVLAPTAPKAPRATGRACACSARTRRTATGDHAAQRPLRRLCAEGERGQRSRKPLVAAARALAGRRDAGEGARAARRCRARSRAIPTSSEPILAGIGRYGAYVQHGKTYANLGRDDDVLEIGGNRRDRPHRRQGERAGGSRVSRRRRGARTWRASGGRARSA